METDNNKEFEVINLSATDSIIGQYLCEIRDKDYQKKPLCNRIFYCDYCCSEIK